MTVEAMLAEPMMTIEQQLQQLRVEPQLMQAMNRYLGLVYGKGLPPRSLSSVSLIVNPCCSTVLPPPLQRRLRRSAIVAGFVAGFNLFAATLNTHPALVLLNLSCVAWMLFLMYKLLPMCDSKPLPSVATERQQAFTALQRALDAQPPLPTGLLSSVLLEHGFAIRLTEEAADVGTEFSYP